MCVEGLNNYWLLGILADSILLIAFYASIGEVDSEHEVPTNVFGAGPELGFDEPFSSVDIPVFEVKVGSVDVGGAFGRLSMNIVSERLLKPI